MARDQGSANRGGQRAGAGQMDLVHPDGASSLLAVGEVEAHLLPIGQRVEIDDVEPEHLAERGRIAAQPDVVGGVDDAAEERHDERAAVLHKADQPRRGLVGDQVQAGRDHQPVLREVVARVGEVHSDVGLEQRPVESFHLLDLAHAAGGFGRQLERPPRLPVEEDRDRGRTLRARHRLEVAQLATESHDVVPHGRLLDRSMRNHRAVELLGPRARLPPLKEHDAVRAMRHSLEAPQPHLARRLRHVDLSPVDAARSLFHEDPRSAVTERAHEVARHRRAHGGRRIRRVGIGIEADQVFVRRPLPVVERLETDHEVGGDGHVRGGLLQDLVLGVVALEQRVGGETEEVQLLAGIGPGGRAPRRHDLVPRAVSLGPEVGAPGFVQLLDRPVARLQPFAEGGGRDVAVARRDMAAVFVADVPHDERGVLRVVVCHRLDQPPRRRAIDRAAGAVMLSCAGPQPHPVGQHGQHLGVPVRKPGRR